MNKNQRKSLAVDRVFSRYTQEQLLVLSQHCQLYNLICDEEKKIILENKRRKPSQKKRISKVKEEVV